MNLQKGLVGHWTMDSRDTSNLTARDRSSYGNEGTHQIGSNRSSIPTGLDGPVGEAYEFSGANNVAGSSLADADATWVEVPNDSKLNPTDEVTVSGWVYSYGTQSNNGGTMFWNGNNNGYGVEPRNDIVRINYGGEWVALSCALDHNAWMHVTWVYDNGTAILYKNGTEVERRSDLTLSANSSNPWIGRRNGHYSHEFDGLIGDVRVYDRAITESEINALVQQRSHRSKNLSYWFESFHNGNLNRWDVTQASIATDRTRTDGHAAFTTNQVTTGPQFRTAPFTNGKEISKVEYWWQETSNSTGHGIRFKNSNGNYECGAATDNPQWDIEDGNGWSENVHPSGPGYDNWIRWTFDFDWSAGTFDVDFESENGTRLTDSGRPLINGTNIQHIEIWKCNSTTWGADHNIETWHDNFKVYL